jgi:hypothetical protein
VYTLTQELYLGVFDDAYYCPTSNPLSLGLSLGIGLGVGIPVLVVIVVLICMRVKKGKKYSQVEMRK